MSSASIATQIIPIVSTHPLRASKKKKGAREREGWGHNQKSEKQKKSLSQVPADFQFSHAPSAQSDAPVARLILTILQPSRSGPRIRAAQALSGAPRRTVGAARLPLARGDRASRTAGSGVRGTRLVEQIYIIALPWNWDAVKMKTGLSSLFLIVRRATRLPQGRSWSRCAMQTPHLVVSRYFLYMYWFYFFFFRAVES
jgi:hypothetical protein